MHQMKCRDVGMDCDFVAKGKTQEEVLTQAREHGKTTHNLLTLTKELEQKVRSAIKEI